MLDPTTADKLVDTNPKTAVGRSKPDFSLVPPVAIAHEADAFMDGATKYGPYNWRDKTVSIRTYIAAAMRHISQFQDGELFAEDSNVHHLGHARACLGIILDAMSVGNAIDDRPSKGAVGAAIEQIKERRSEGATPTFQNDYSKEVAHIRTQMDLHKARIVDDAKRAVGCGPERYYPVATREGPEPPAEGRYTGRVG